MEAQQGAYKDYCPFKSPTSASGQTKALSQKMPSVGTVGGRMKNTEKREALTVKWLCNSDSYQPVLKPLNPRKVTPALRWGKYGIVGRFCVGAPLRGLSLKELTILRHALLPPRRFHNELRAGRRHQHANLKRLHPLWG